MGQKVQPVGIRLGITSEWTSRWFATGRDYAKYLKEDAEVRSFIRGKLSNAAISDITIERPAQNMKVVIHTARPGTVIGQKGEDISILRRELTEINGAPVSVSVEEIRKPDLDAKLVAESICQQLEKRMMFRRAMKRAVQNSMRVGALGVKVMISGRLNGAEIARTEWYREGRVPLHTFRAKVDYGLAEAHTTYGVLGVKVWIFTGEVFQEKREPAAVGEVKSDA
ncbi:MAG: 30S ribosomal protein S3 [Acidiferrobacterales bacterium]|nr:30S ribosomal protein S3 [Acidiferrobacterales bacterium]